MTEETYDANGTRLSSREAPFARTFVVRRATGDRWLNVAVLPAATGADPTRRLDDAVPSGTMPLVRRRQPGDEGTQCERWPATPVDGKAACR